MMNLNFLPKDVYSSEKCSICWNPLKKDVVTHLGTGEKHPFHKACVYKWIFEQATCPVCRVDINPMSILSKIEKINLYLEKRNAYYWLERLLFISIFAFKCFPRFRLSNTAEESLTCIVIISGLVAGFTNDSDSLSRYHCNRIKIMNIGFTTLYFTAFLLNYLYYSSKS